MSIEFKPSRRSRMKRLARAVLGWSLVLLVPVFVGLVFLLAIFSPSLDKLPELASLLLDHFT